MTYLFDNSIIYDTSDTSDTVDAAGRARVVQPLIDFSSEFPDDKVPDSWDEDLLGSVTSTHDANISAIIMETSTASGDRVIRQTKRRFRYQPASSGSVSLAFRFGSGQTNNRKRVGLFDFDNGFFFEQDGTDLSVVRRTSTTGTVQDIKTDQSNWNVDVLDGTGPSAIILDVTKVQDAIIGYEWYGAGIIKYGFRIRGKTVWVHVEQAGNNLDAPFVSRPVLPLRWEIENTGTTSTNNSIAQLGASVVREGGTTLAGFPRSFNTGITPAIIDSIEFHPIISIRLKSGNLGSLVEPLSVAVFNTSNQTILWELVLNPTLTGASWVSSSRAVEGDVSATDVTGGTVLASGYTLRVAETVLQLEQLRLILGSNINDVPDILTIRARTINSTIDSFARIDYKEIA